MINAGDLQWTATVRRESSFDNLGRREGDFSTSAGTFRCKVEDRGVQEIEWGDGVAVARSYLITARWDSVQQRNLTERDRLRITPGNFIVRISGISDQALAGRVALIEATEIVQ